MSLDGIISGARVTHQTAAVDDLAAVSPESHESAVRELLAEPAVTEAFVLSTCNRVESYVVTADRADGRRVLAGFFDAAAASTVRESTHEESCRHLLRVACGLESVVVGEDQIIGQLREAYTAAQRAGGIDAILEPAVTKAIHVGERARTETAINEGIVSLGSAAARLVADEVDLDGTTALIVGAGEMARLAARNLDEHGPGEILVANRTVDRAASLSDTLDASGRAIGLDELEGAVAEATVVVTATGSAEPVLSAAELGVADHDRVLVDLGQPRDVDPDAREIAGVIVYDLDDLHSITEETRTARAAAAKAVERIVDEECTRLLERYKRCRADAVIAAMYESADRIKRQEVETALSRLEETEAGISDAQREIVGELAAALVNQLLAAPTKSLREAAGEDDWETITTALGLFDPEFGPDRSQLAASFAACNDDSGPEEAVFGFGEDD